MVNLTAKDGLTTIEVLEHNGRTYHLPPWIPRDEFIAGIDSDEHEEGLSHLISLELATWQTANGGYSEPLAATFDATWEFPLEGIFELVLERFTPKLNDRFGGYEPEIEILEDDEKIRITMRVEEYVDFNDVQLIVFPKGEFPEEYLEMKWSDEILDEYHADPEDFIHQVTGWDGLHEEFEHPVSGKATTLLLKVHED